MGALIGDYLECINNCEFVGPQLQEYTNHPELRFQHKQCLIRISISILHT